MVTLARNLDFAGSCFLTPLTAIFVARLRQALTWKVCALRLLICCHHCSPFRNSILRFLWSPLSALFIPWRTVSIHNMICQSVNLVASEIDLQDLQEL
jgi:hypothetical protein